MDYSRTLRYLIFLLFYLLLNNISPIFTNPVITAKMTSHMSDCERSLHNNCIVNQGSYKILVVDCNEELILNCLKAHLKKGICTNSDKDTLPTIKQLIEMVKKRFRKNKKCANDLFMNSINDHFLVQGEGIEYTDPQKYDYSSGSGDYTDDSEGGDQNEDGTIDSNENSIKNPVNNDVSKTIKFWRQNAAKIQNGKSSNIQLLVFFDDPQQYKKNKQKEKQKVSNKLKSEWQKLTDQYSRWYRSSKYYLGS